MMPMRAAQFVIRPGMHGTSASLARVQNLRIAIRGFSKMRCDAIRRSRGFTLIELVLVMAIIAILALSLAPSLHEFGARQRSSDAATLLVSMADYARTEAISQGYVYRLNLEPAQNQVWLTYQNGGDFTEVASDLGKRITLSPGISMRTDVASQQDGTYVAFQPSGRTDPAHIWLTDTVGGSQEVACTSPTEQFRILSPQETTR
jgi:prepilin-type N-terminal cleavage/methylation domain-containing protein